MRAPQAGGGSGGGPVDRTIFPDDRVLEAGDLDEAEAHKRFVAIAIEHRRSPCRLRGAEESVEVNGRQSRLVPDNE